MSGQIQDQKYPPAQIKSDLAPGYQPSNSLNDFFPKKQTTSAAVMLSHSTDDCDENGNVLFGRTSNSAREIAPKPSAPSLKRKVGAISVSDDEDASPVGAPSNASAQAHIERLIAKKMTKNTKVAIGADWAAVRNNSLITQVRQFSKSSPGGYRTVDQTETYLPDSGRKHKGVNQLTPILSFMVKEFKDGILVLSGQSVAVAKGVQEISNPNVSLSIIV